MSSRRQRLAEMGMHLLVTASALTVVVAVVVAVRRAATPPDADAQWEAIAMPVPSDEPIAVEARVFRTRSSMLAIGPTPGARREAHPRTLGTYRSLRAYPGAPPRIPHGLTPSEFRTGGCNTCHERGGFSQRFGAYVPVTPHPEMGACLQCHVGDAKLMAISLPSTDPSARCRQCHAADAARWTESTVDWKPMAWPVRASDLREGEPPPIPHELHLRGNCLACHSAPAAVVEIRTSHPERTNCRQCHVSMDTETDVFVRPARRDAGGREGAP